MPRGKKNNKKKEKMKKLDVVKKEWAEQTDEEKEDTVSKVVAAFTEMKLKSVEVVVAKETQYPEGFSVEHFAGVGSCTEAQGRELSKYSNLMDVFDKFEVEVSSVVVGSKMPFLVSAFDLAMKESTLLEDRRGKVIVLQFWTPENKCCEDALQALMDLAAKRKGDWADKVCLLTVCCEVDKDELTKVLNDRSWFTTEGLVEHLLAGEGGDEDEDNVVNKYEIETLPSLLLVDKEGCLSTRGDPEDFNVEELIDQLLAGESVQATPAPPVGNWQALEEAKREELTKKCVAVLKSDPNLADVLLVTTEATIHSTSGGPQRKELDLMVVGKVDIRAAKLVQGVMDVLEKDGGVKDVEKTVVVTSPERPLVPTEACSECGKKFADMDQKKLVRWHCSMCIDSYTVCEECEPERKHEKYHPLFRMGPGVEKEDMEKAPFSIGSFAVCMVSAEAAEEGKQHEVIHEDVYCNGCKAGPIAEGARWKCCSCPDFDLCSACYDKYLEHTEGRKATPRPKKEGGGCGDHGFNSHDPSHEKPKKPWTGKHQRNHFFLRIDDSELVQIAESDDEGDEGDFDFAGADFDDADMDLLSRAMAGEVDDMDTEAIVAKLNALRASGKLDEIEGEGDEDGPTIEEVTVATDDVLVSLQDEALQVPLPDDDF